MDSTQNASRAMQSHYRKAAAAVASGCWSRSARRFQLDLNAVGPACQARWVHGCWCSLPGRAGACTGGGECGRFPASRPCNGGAPLPRRAHQSPSPVDNCGRHRRRRFRGRSSRRAAAGPRCSVPAYLVGSSYFRLFPPTPPYSQFCLHPAVVHASAPTRQSPCRLSVRLLCSQSVGITPPLFCIPIGPPAHCSALPPRRPPTIRLPACPLLDPSAPTPWPVGTRPPRRPPSRGGPSGWGSASRRPPRRQHPTAAAA